MTNSNWPRCTRISLATMFLSSAVALFSSRALAQEAPAPDAPPMDAPATQPESAETPAPAVPARVATLDARAVE
ncbi:hypothetical protein BH09PLA1_BH09PLA1_29720 [soil metagenome]